MPKRSKSGKVEKASTFHSIHKFKSEDAKEFTTSLLKWYHSNKRDLPWRSLEEDLSPTDKAYAGKIAQSVIVLLLQLVLFLLIQFSHFCFSSGLGGNVATNTSCNCASVLYKMDVSLANIWSPRSSIFE